MAQEFVGSIIFNQSVAKNQFEMVIETTRALPKVVPGQFCMLSVNDSAHLLRRPLGIYRILGKKQFSVLYKIVGEGTQLLSLKQKKEKLSILLPIGNGYPSLDKTQLTYVVAGGIGLGSVSLLLNTEKHIKFFYGAKTQKEFVSLGFPQKNIFYATDDGSKGNKGFVVEPVKKNLKQDIKNGDNPVIYACGPSPMLKSLYESVHSISQNVKMFFSLEERMACGIGVCMGCVVNIQGEYKRVCVDGPVFEADDIVWE